jgi:hypothetical protein
VRAGRVHFVSNNQTKECPFCAETIKAAACLCRFCGRDLLPHPAAASFPPSEGAALPAEPSVATSIQQTEIFDLLTALIEKSLVVYEEDEQGRGRYRMLETVRQYSRDRLLEAEEASDLRQRHAAFFLALAEEIILKISRDEPVAWLGRLEAEYDNMRAALDWTLGSDAEVALRLVGVLGRFWQVRSRLTEGREWLERALEAGREASPSLQARALNWLSGLMHWQGDYARMTEVLEETRALAQQAGDTENLAFAVGGLAMDAHVHGDHARAGKLAEQAVRLLREAGVNDPWTAAGAMVVVAGIAAATRSDLPTAELFREAQAVCRATGNPFVIGGCCRTEGFFAQQRGDDQRALALFREGLLAAHEVGHTAGIHNALEGVAAAWAAQGRADRAARLLGAAEAVRTARQWSILPLWMGQHDQAVASARAILGEEAFAAAWQEGQAMSLPQTIEYALELEEAPS